MKIEIQINDDARITIAWTVLVTAAVTVVYIATAYGGCRWS